MEEVFLILPLERIVESLKRKGILKSFAIQPVRNLFLDRSGNRVHQGLHHFCSIAMPVCYPWFRIVALCFVLNLAQQTRCDIYMDCFLSTFNIHQHQTNLCLLSFSHLRKLFHFAEILQYVGCVFSSISFRFCLVHRHHFFQLAPCPIVKVRIPLGKFPHGGPVGFAATEKR